MPGVRPTVGAGVGHADRQSGLVGISNGGGFGTGIRPLPADANRVRGFTANFLIVDEAARVSDEVYAAATPMLAATDGALWILSTPRGRKGFFYEEWMAKDGGTHPWFRLSAGAETSGRIQPGYLATERRRKTADQFASEFECAFVSQDRQVFAEEWLERSFSAETPIFDDCSRADLRYMQHRPTYYLGRSAPAASSPPGRGRKTHAGGRRWCARS